MQTKRRHQERGGAWPADAPCRTSTPAREGRGSGDTLTPSRRPPHPSPPSAPYSRLRTDPAARSQDLPTQRAPTPGPSQGGETSSPGVGLEACGAGQCAPHPCPPRAAGRERRSNPRLRGPAWAGSLAFQDTPPPESGGRGAAAGKSDPTTSASVQARPKLSDAGGEPGATRGPGEDPGRGSDSTEDPPTLLSLAPPDQSALPDPKAASTARPTPETPRSSLRGVHERSGADSCLSHCSSLRL